MHRYIMNSKNTMIRNYHFVRQLSGNAFVVFLIDVFKINLTKKTPRNIFCLVYLIPDKFLAMKL